MSLRERTKDKMFDDRKKGTSKYDDPRFAGKTVNKVRQQQRREHVLRAITRRAQGKKRWGMSLFPEEEWVLANKNLFL